MTIMLFDLLEAVREFAGQDYEQALFRIKQGQYYLFLTNARNIMKSEEKENVKYKNR